MPPAASVKCNLSADMLMVAAQLGQATAFHREVLEHSVAKLRLTHWSLFSESAALRHGDSIRYEHRALLQDVLRENVLRSRYSVYRSS